MAFNPQPFRPPQFQNYLGQGIGQAISSIGGAFGSVLKQNYLDGKAQQEKVYSTIEQDGATKGLEQKDRDEILKRKQELLNQAAQMSMYDFSTGKKKTGLQRGKWSEQEMAAILDQGKSILSDAEMMKQSRARIDEAYKKVNPETDDTEYLKNAVSMYDSHRAMPQGPLITPKPQDYTVPINTINPYKDQKPTEKAVGEYIQYDYKPLSEEEKKGIYEQLINSNVGFQKAQLYKFANDTRIPDAKKVEMLQEAGSSDPQQELEDAHFNNVGIPSKAQRQVAMFYGINQKEYQPIGDKYQSSKKLNVGYHNQKLSEAKKKQETKPYSRQEGIVDPSGNVKNGIVFSGTKSIDLPGHLVNSVIDDPNAQVEQGYVPVEIQAVYDDGSALGTIKIPAKNVRKEITKEEAFALQKNGGKIITIAGDKVPEDQLTRDQQKRIKKGIISWPTTDKYYTEEKQPSQTKTVQFSTKMIEPYLNANYPGLSNDMTKWGVDNRVNIDW